MELINLKLLSRFPGGDLHMKGAETLISHLGVYVDLIVANLPNGHFMKHEVE